jgi:hypothetical protein
MAARAGVRQAGPVSDGTGAGPTSCGLALGDGLVPAAEGAQGRLMITGQSGPLHRLVDDILDLALAPGLITRRSGTIEAGRAPDGGVAVTVRLPPAAAWWSV